MFELLSSWNSYLQVLYLNPPPTYHQGSPPPTPTLHLISLEIYGRHEDTSCAFHNIHRRSRGHSIRWPVVRNPSNSPTASRQPIVLVQPSAQFHACSVVGSQYEISRRLHLPCQCQRSEGNQLDHSCRGRPRQGGHHTDVQWERTEYRVSVWLIRQSSSSGRGCHQSTRNTIELRGPPFCSKPECCRSAHKVCPLLPQHPPSCLRQTDEVVASRFQFNFTALNLVLPVDIDAWNTYNSKGEITQYDATFKYWQWVVDYLIGAAGKKFGTKSLEATVGVLTQTIAKSICGTATKSCNGTNTQYASPAECLNFLTKQVRFGKAYELGMLLPLYFSPPPPPTLPVPPVYDELPPQPAKQPSLPRVGKNTLLCRMVHQNMVPFRPDVHCSHIGPSGGGYCSDDKSYLQTVSENYFERSPYVPFGFVGQGGGGASGPVAA